VVRFRGALPIRCGCGVPEAASERGRGGGRREMRDVVVVVEDCVRVLGPGPEVRAYEEG
jgi:hypothetical protein